MSSGLELEPQTEEKGRKKAPQLVEKAGLAVYWNAVFLPLKLLVGLAATVVLLRLLKVQEVALYAKVSALVTLLGAITDLGIERALPRFVPEVEVAGGRAGVQRFLRDVSLLRVVTLAPFVLAIVIFPVFFWDLLDLGPNDLPDDVSSLSQLQPLLLGIVIALLTLGAVYDICMQLLYTYFRQKVTNLLDILNSLLLPTLRTLLVVLIGVLGAIYGLLSSTLIMALVAVVLVVRALAKEAPPEKRRATDIRPDPRTFWRRFLSMSMLMQVITVSALLYDQAFVVTMMNALIPNDYERNLGIALAVVCFGFVRRLLGALVTPMAGVQTPLFSRLYAENRLDGLRTAYTSLTKFLILILVPAGVGLIIVSRNLIALLFVQIRSGQAVTEQTLPTVVTATSILIVGLFIEAIISVSMNVLVVFEKHRVVLVSRLVTLISIPLLALLIPPYGIVGAAIAVAITALASRSVALIYATRVLDLPFPFQFGARVVGATCAFGLVIAPLASFLQVPPTSINLGQSLLLALANGLLILAGIAIFFLVFRLLGGIDPADKLRFAGMRIPGIKLALRFL